MNTRSNRNRFCLPPAPTNALPGSPEKVRILAERARLGVSLWHQLDATLTAAPESHAADDTGPADLGLAS